MSVISQKHLDRLRTMLRRMEMIEERLQALHGDALPRTTRAAAKKEIDSLQAALAHLESAREHASAPSDKPIAYIRVNTAPRKTHLLEVCSYRDPGARPVFTEAQVAKIIQRSTNAS